MLVASNIALQGSGQIDLKTGAMILDYNASDPSPLSLIRSKVISAYSGGAWTGHAGDLGWPHVAAQRSGERVDGGAAATAVRLC